MVVAEATCAVPLLGLAVLMVISEMTVIADELTTQPEFTESREETKQQTKSSNFIRAILDSTDSRLRPLFGGDPVEVKCGFYVISFGSISEVSMDYSLNIFLRQSWQDKRTSFAGDPESIVLNAKGIDLVWTPDLYFTNEKRAAFHDITVPNRRIRLFQNGTVVYSVRLSLTLSCPMDLSHFPMDKQTCSIGLESYAYDSTELTLKWTNDNPVEINQELELPQFDLEHVELTEIEHLYKTGGNFSHLRAVFTLQRQYGFYLLQTFVPSILIVVLSWVSFWICRDAVPARISLSVTTVLTMTTQLSGSKTAIPRVSYPKAIDVWMSVCMIFVFAALLEYAFVNTLSRRSKKIKYRQTEGETLPEKRLSTDDTENWRTRIGSIFDSDEPACTLDKASRILFPASFLFFNIVYWAVYLPKQY